MTVPTVQLTGPAVWGLFPQVALRAAAGRVRDVPVSVRLGRLPSAPPAHVPKLADYLLAHAFAAVPDKVDWTPKARASLGRMFANDRLGDCVVAGSAHALGVWSANDSDSGGEVQPADGEVIAAYQEWCGPGDNGCYIPVVLDRLVRDGLRVNGQPHKLAGYAAIEGRDAVTVKVAMALFGCVKLGLNLPAEWTQAAVWDITTSSIVGGHDVTGVGYDARGVYVASWGRVYLLTWRALADRRFVDECYVMLSPDWSNNDQLAPSGVNVPALVDALRVFAGGGVPPIPDTPPAPPVDPPAPPALVPSGVYDVSGTIEGTGFRGRGTFTGTARPQAAPQQPDLIELDAGDVVAAGALVDVLERVKGIRLQASGQRFRVRRDGLTPGQWQIIITAVIAFLEALRQMFGQDGSAPLEFSQE